MNKEFLDFLSSDIFKSIMTILFSSMTTYLLTKSSEGKNDKEVYI